jgi:hypothetical protein
MLVIFTLCGAGVVPPALARSDRPLESSGVWFDMVVVVEEMEKTECSLI